MLSIKSDEEATSLQNEPNNTCGMMDGKLPGRCAAMVFPYVPVQENSPQVYPGEEALEKGTLFPGLYLPFHKQMKTRFGGNNGPLCELMALHFAIVELGLYLDTHEDDTEAFAMFKNYTALYEEGKRRYEKQYGPLQQLNAAQFGSYKWLNDPWPWEYEGGVK